jgi:ribosomal protein S27AE
LPLPSPEIHGHPTAPLLDDRGDLITMITVCAHCGNTRTILFLRKDRWFCTKCRMEGAAPPNLYPIA